jgi:hypothetical protein
MRKITTFLAVALASLAVAAPAFAQSATEDAYRGVAATQQFDNGGTGGTGATTTSSDSLPFTGLELGLIALVGAGLLGAGFAIRRVSRPGAAA